MHVVQNNLVEDDFHPSPNVTLKGAYLNDTCTGQNNWITSILASSWVPLVGRQLTGGGSCDTCDTVYQYFESKYATLGDSVGDGAANDMFFYNTTGTEQLLATANLALSMAVGNATLERLYSSTAISDYDPEKPYLAHVPWPFVMVRRAHYLEARRELNFTVLASRKAVHGAVLVCGGYETLITSDDHIEVLRDGVAYSNWTTGEQNGQQQLSIQADLDNDTVFQIRFLTKARGDDSI